MKLKYSTEWNVKDLYGERFSLWGADKYIHLNFENSAQAVMSVYPTYLIVRQKNKEDAVKDAD